MTRRELKDSLKRIKMTQKDFAKICGVRPETVNRWINGGIRVPFYAEIMFTMEYEGIDIERKLRRLVDEGHLFDGIGPENCPSYREVLKLIQKVKAIEKF